MVGTEDWRTRNHEKSGSASKSGSVPSKRSTSVPLASWISTTTESTSSARWYWTIPSWTPRTAGSGSKTVSVAFSDSGVYCRSGWMSSRIQKPRPWVPSTTSASLTTRSRIGVSGRFCWRDTHWSPSSQEAYTPCSVPRKSSPWRTGSSRTARAKCPGAMPFTIFVQVAP